MMHPTSLRKPIAAVILALCIGGCGGLSTVQPWEKGILSRPEMTFEGDPLEARFIEHVYGSKEAASGGTGIGGGGCGCN